MKVIDIFIDIFKLTSGDPDVSLKISNCSSNRECSDIAKMSKLLARDLKYNWAVLKYCTYQQPNVSELETALSWS